MRAYQTRAPFRAFTVELVSGSRFQVDHPESLILRSGVAVFLDREGTPVLFDHEGVSQVIGDSADMAG